MELGRRERLERRACLFGLEAPVSRSVGPRGLWPDLRHPEPVPWAEFSSAGASWAQLLGQGYAWCWGIEQVAPTRRYSGRTWKGAALYKSTRDGLVWVGKVIRIPPRETAWGPAGHHG